MLLLHQTLNNSAAICRDESGQEYLLLGKGIAFGKRRLAEIDLQGALRVFPLTERNHSKLETMAAEIPYAYFEIAEAIRQRAEESLGQRLDDEVLMHLADHIHYSVQKLHRGISTPNLILTEIRMFYRREYETGVWATEEINRRFHSSFGEDEAGFIAFHIAGAEGSGTVDVEKTATFLGKTLRMIERHFGVHLDVDSLDYGRLVTHLKFLSVRMQESGSEEPCSLVGDGLYESLRDTYPSIDSFLDKMSAMTAREYDHVLSDTDRMYLLIHLARVLRSKGS